MSRVPTTIPLAPWYKPSLMPMAKFKRLSFLSIFLPGDLISPFNLLSFSVLLLIFNKSRFKDLPFEPLENSLLIFDKFTESDIVD